MKDRSLMIEAVALALLADLGKAQLPDDSKESVGNFCDRWMSRLYDEVLLRSKDICLELQLEESEEILLRTYRKSPAHRNYHNSN